MLHVASADEIGDLLVELPTLFHLQEQRSVDFPQRAREWLGALESVLIANRLYQAGLVGALASGIASAEQGQLPTGIQFQGRMTRSKAATAMASRALHGAADIAAAIMAENSTRFGEAERVASQLVAVAQARELLPPRKARSSSLTYLREVRQALASVPDLETALIHLEGLVGRQDALVFLDRALGVQSTDAPEE